MGAGASARKSPGEEAITEGVVEEAGSVGTRTDAPSAMNKSVNDLLRHELQLNSAKSDDEVHVNSAYPQENPRPVVQPLANPMLVVFKAAGISSERTDFAIDGTHNDIHVNWWICFNYDNVT